MKKLFSLLSIFAIVLSCSSDETSTSVTPPPAPIVKYTITLSAGEGGTVSTTGGEYELGQTVSVTATPQGEYLFKDWSDGNTDATRTITVSSNSTLTANFEKRKYPLTLNIEGEGEVLEEIVNAGRTTDYDSGTTVKLTAVPAEGWEFAGWTGGIESTELEVQLLVNEAKEVNAEFRELEMKSISVLNPIDTLVISRKHKFQISGTYTNGNSIDLTDLATIDLTDEKITLLDNNEFTAGKSGQTSIKISYNNLEIIEDLYINYYEELLNEQDNYLKQNENNLNINVPVVIINFHPTLDGVNIDSRRYIDDYFIKDRFYNYYDLDRNVCSNIDKNNPLCKIGTLEMYKIRSKEIHMFTKFGIEEGSKFRAYKNNSSEKSINIQVLKYFNFYELKTKIYGNKVTPQPDYQEIFDIINLEYLVNNFGVKEVWFSIPPLDVEYPNIQQGLISSDFLLNLPESNMSSPHGDVSNSARITGDLPVYNKTYVVYGINVDRGPGESLHNRGHQIEAQFGYIDRNNNDYLFWNKFVGVKLNNNGLLDFSKQAYNGRSGNTHFPPNASADYDWGNQTEINSDINNWLPSGGINELVNTNTWTNIKYNLPFETKFFFEESNLDGFRNDTQYKWLLYWFQSMPGENNNIPYIKDGINYKLTNWWDLFYNWDGVITENKTLWE